MEVGLVQKVDIDTEMQQAYLDYAMSVIVARALPDARDGLKPVHRRILYAMYDMGLRMNSAHKKSARIVGEVLGKYHPHGDMAVYDAMARMAQDFSMRQPLIDGQGNFGSVDGDPPAAMRYTEARLAAPSLEMLADIGRDTVDFANNFDDTLREPTVLPAAIPNLLVNGATGIAVGMSTSIPPHNLGEVVDALRMLLKKWEKVDDVSLDEIMQYIQGPDFPTGGLIVQKGEEDTLASAYGSGRGRITVQARTHLEEMGRGRNRIIVTELPYMTNKASLIERIASLARDERVEGIVDLRDESDRQGMRIVIELSKTADPEAVLRSLYKHTPMQTTFSIIMLALVDGEPRLLSLKQALRVYLEHRLEIIRRRSEYDLDKARHRLHILEGLRVALKNLDAVINLIRRAPDVDVAKARLMRRFKLSDIQAQAILDMQLRRLASLERKKIELEYKEVRAQIKELESLLRSPRKMRGVIADELLKVKDAYDNRRRTQIARLDPGKPGAAILTASDLLPEKDVWLAVTPGGLVSLILDGKSPRLSGSEAPGWLLQVNTRDTLFLVAEDGKAAAVPVHNIPEVEKPSQGIPFAKISALTSDQRLAVVFTLPPKRVRAENVCVVTITRQGMVKKTLIGEFPGPSAEVFTLVKVNAGDSLGWVHFAHGEDEILLLTARGMAIRFAETDVRPMGMVAAGVMGIKLQAADEVAGALIVPRKGDVFMIADDGTAKRIALRQFPKQGRYGQGVVAWKLPAGARVVGMAVGKGTKRVTLHLAKLAAKMVRLDAAPLQGRPARGKVVLPLKEGDRILRLTVPLVLERPVIAAKAKPPRKKKPVAGGKQVTTARRKRARKTSGTSRAKKPAGPAKGTRKNRSQPKKRTPPKK